MTISNTKIAQTIGRITTISGIQHVPTDVITDVVDLANVFPNDLDFDSAADNVIRSILQIKRNPRIGGPLRENYAGYRSFHYQSKRVNNHPDDMRTVYREDNGVIYLHGFGHRHNPDSVYKRFQDR